MTQQQSLIQHTLPYASNDNDLDRFMSLDLEPHSLDAEAFIDDLTTLLDPYNSKSNKFRLEVRTAIVAIVGDLMATAAKGRARYAYRPLGAASFENWHVGRVSFKRALDAMEAGGLAEVVPGKQYGSGTIEERGTATRIRATAAFHEMALGYGVTAATLPFHFHEMPRRSSIANPVLLRSSTTHYKGRRMPGKRVKFDKTIPFIKAMGRQINDVNGFLAEQDLILGKYKHRFFQRIFGQGDCSHYGWNKGGRLYSPGLDSYQQAPIEERAAFLFNGEATVEIDIGSSFLTIYRVKSGIKFDPAHDPYDIPGLRRFASKSWTVMTFGHDRHHSRWPADVKAKYKKKFEEGAEGDWGTGNLQQDHPFGETQRLMLKALPELVAWPKSATCWGDLQYAESCAVINAVWTLAIKHGVVALPVHDSIRVPVSKRGLATQVLSEAFREHVGVAPVLKTK